MAKPVRYGGQAVIEGVMMRGAKTFAVACRRANGEILVRDEPVPAFFTRYAWAKLPFLRGVFALADSLVLGMKSLLFSANLAMEDQQAAAAASAEAGEPPDTPGAPPMGPLTQALLGPVWLFVAAGGLPGGGAISSISVTGSAILGLALGIGLFMILPGLAAQWLTPILGETIWRAVVEGLMRVALMLGYIALIGRMKEVQRVFQYHGAEHKAINALETEGTLDVDAAVRASRIHPRCGTNFVLTVLIIKMLVVMVLPWQEKLHLIVLLRLALLPLVASISFEIIRLAGTYRDIAPLQWLVTPGLLTQQLTTREPARDMVEVAVASLQRVMQREGALPAEDSPAAAVA